MKFNAKTEKAYFYNLSRGNYNKPSAIQPIVKILRKARWFDYSIAISKNKGAFCKFNVLINVLVVKHL